MNDPEFQKVLDAATETFGSEKKARVWLETPNIALCGVAPLSICSNPDGCMQVESLLRKIKTGEFT